LVLASTWGLTMLRAVVLVLCLASAGGIAAYSYYSRGGTAEPVYTVPSRLPSPEPKASMPKHIAPEDHAALARELQRELKRVGCYSGEISGVWTTSSRLAMKTFIERVNAALPIDKPDPVLLSLVQGHRERACGVGCPPGQTAQAGGACVPSAVAGDTAKEPPPDAETDGAKMSATAAVAGAAAATGLATAGAAAKEDLRKPDAKGVAPEAKGDPPEKRPKRPKRATKRPPKLVSDFLKLFGN
jgi:hypothetical protein